MKFVAPEQASQGESLDLTRVSGASSQLPVRLSQHLWVYTTPDLPKIAREQTQSRIRCLGINGAYLPEINSVVHNDYSSARDAPEHNFLQLLEVLGHETYHASKHSVLTQVARRFHHVLANLITYRSIFGEYATGCYNDTPAIARLERELGEDLSASVEPGVPNPTFFTNDPLLARKLVDELVEIVDYIAPLMNPATAQFTDLYGRQPSERKTE